MADLVQNVTDGKVDQSTNTSTSASTGTSSLDKDAFLQLLVTQMKYQDPLNPSTDTQFVEQLATFSQLEQMQNLNQTYSNSQAFGLVGMYVDVAETDSAGKTSIKSGYVDYVVLSNGKAQLSIDGSLYSTDQLQQVYDSTYIIKKGLPYVPKEVEAAFDKADPEDITFEVNLGSGDTVASDVAVIINDTVVDSDHVTLSGNKVTIKKEALEDLEDGTYKIILVFNDSLYTTVSDKITIKVTGSSSDEDSDSGDNTDEDSGNSDDGSDSGEDSEL